MYVLGTVLIFFMFHGVGLETDRSIVPTHTLLNIM